MKVRTLAVAVAAALLVLAAQAALADPGGKGRHGNPHQRESRDERGEGDQAGAIISAVERGLIRDYYRDSRPDQGYDRLPPGIRKNLARGKPLPPGIAKKMPDDLRHRLPYRDGYDYRVVGADVLLVEIATGAIADILRGVLR